MLDVMFLALLLVTFAVATFVSVIVVYAFSKPVGQILARIIADEISSAWQRYVVFALYVVGISSGVQVWIWKSTSPRPIAGRISSF